MKIFFLRHTSLNIEPDIFYGQTDIDVSETFDKEVKIIKEKLMKNEIKLTSIKIYTSPLMRCVKLTKKISEKFEIDDRIKEMNLGDWEMKKMNSISENQKNEWENNLLSFKIPNGESNEEFLLRLKLFLNDIKRQNKDTLVVCHAGSINGMISILTDQPFEELVKNYWEKIKYGSLSLIELKDKIIIKKIIGS